MTEFEFLAIGISLILGLGVTLLLTSFLAVFVNRRNVRIDWIPLVWAFYILIIQVQYYSAMWNLNSRTEWTFLTFAAPLMVAGVIFLAAGLVLPSGSGAYPSDLRVYFEQHGKWAVSALVIRGILAILANYFVLRGNQSFSIIEILIGVQVVVALLFLISKKRKFQIAFTIIYGVVFSLTLTIVVVGQYLNANG